MLFKRVCNLISRRSAICSPMWNSPSVRLYADQQETPRVEKSINEVKLLGRVGADPQKRGTEQHPVVLFSVATHVNYKYESGEFMQRTDWHRVCVFKPMLRDTVYNYCKKGSRVYVSGRLTYGEIKDEAGVSRQTTAVVADDVIFFQSGGKYSNLADDKLFQQAAEEK